VPGNPTSEQSPYALSLTPGWNGVASPWLTAVDWADSAVTVTYQATTLPLTQAVAQGWIDASVTDHNSVSGGDPPIPPAPRQLVPWRGYELFANVACQLKFSPPPVPVTTPPHVDLTTPVDDGADVTTLTQVMGTAEDPALFSWVLDYSPTGTNTFTPLGTGTG